MGFCQRCGNLVHGSGKCQCGGRSVASVTSGLASTNSRADPWVSQYQSILDGGSHRPTKRMSMPATSTKPQPLVIQKQCNGCSKNIHQAKVFVDKEQPTFIYCEKCYTEKFIKGTCPSCFKQVKTKGDPYISHNAQVWHKSCFKCFQCSRNIADHAMVDLKGRPSCENCLMAQAGGHPDQAPIHENQQFYTYSNSSVSTPNRSLTSSPKSFSATQKSAPIPYSTDENGASHLHLSLSPLSLNTDTSTFLNSPARNSPLSAQSVSSQSSFLSSRPSTGSASGTSSTYSTLGRKRSGTLPSVNNADGMATGPSENLSAPPTNGGSTGGGGGTMTLFSSRGSTPASSRPISPRPESPAQFSSDYPVNLSPKESNDHARPRTPSFSSSPPRLNSFAEGESLSPIPSSPAGSVTSNHGQSYSARSSMPAGSSARYPSSLSSQAGDQSLHPGPTTPSGGMSRSGSNTSLAGGAGSRPKTPIAERFQQAVEAKAAAAAAVAIAQSGAARRFSGAVGSNYGINTMPPGLHRARSRSFAEMPETLKRSQTNPGGLEARQANATATAAANTIAAARAARARNSTTVLPSSVAAAAASGRVEKEQFSREDEDERTPIQRHGRNRSNTVGEPVRFPPINTEPEGAPWPQKPLSIPEDHCHKCIEKVTENGVKLPNGDRYHITCFLCAGCQMVFTESEFHMVQDRPYHPSCVPTIMMSPLPYNGGGSILAGAKCGKCNLLIKNRALRLGGVNFHPQCFQCSHCHKVLLSTSRFFDVDGQVECEECCEAKDKIRMGPKVVPMPRSSDSFAMPPPPGIATNNNINNSINFQAPSSPYNSIYQQSRASPGQSGASSPTFSPASPMIRSLSPTSMLTSPNGINNHSNNNFNGSMSSMGSMSPTAARTPPVLTGLFSTRTKPLPKFGGVTYCPRCKDAVGVMDQVPGPLGVKWHKKCLNCADCKKVLDSSALTRGEGKAYCRGCYSKTR